MTFKTSNCVALGVDNKRQAADLYQDVLGFEEVKEGDNWIEMKTGALRIFLCEDEVKVPCFDLETEDVSLAKAHLEQAGFVQVDLSPGEIFMRDPNGYHYCLSKSDS